MEITNTKIFAKEKAGVNPSWKETLLDPPSPLNNHCEDLLQNHRPPTRMSEYTA